MTTTTRGAFLAPVPERLTNVGIVLAAVPTHVPVDAADPTEWIVLCRRTVGGDDPRPFTTNRVQRLGDDVLATGGEYDMTYDEAYADLLHRAGICQTAAATSR